MLDQVDNLRLVFPYRSDFYYPRPDHPAPNDSVQVWSGSVQKPRICVSWSEPA